MSRLTTCPRSDPTNLWILLDSFPKKGGICFYSCGDNFLFPHRLPHKHAWNHAETITLGSQTYSEAASLKVSTEGPDAPLRVISPYSGAIDTNPAPPLWLAARDSDGAEEDVALTAYGAPLHLQVNAPLLHPGGIFIPPPLGGCQASPSMPLPLTYSQVGWAGTLQAGGACIMQTETRDSPSFLDPFTMDNRAPCRKHSMKQTTIQELLLLFPWEDETRLFLGSI